MFLYVLSHLFSFLNTFAHFPLGSFTADRFARAYIGSTIMILVQAIMCITGAGCALVAAGFLLCPEVRYFWTYSLFPLRIRVRRWWLNTRFYRLIPRSLYRRENNTRV